jgi:hypothetical protein
MDYRGLLLSGEISTKSSDDQVSRPLALAEYYVAILREQLKHFIFGDTTQNRKSLD